MEINVLDYRLKLLSVNKKSGSIAKFTHALLDILFLRSTRLKLQHGFASVTETNEDYSIICEEKCLPLLDVCDEDLITVEDVWIPLVVSVGPIGISAAGISKIAKSVVIPLADFGVSVYCLSTYKTDYVLVRERDLERSCEILAADFRITKENLLNSEDIKIERSRIPSRDSSSDTMRPITHTYTSPLNVFHITSMDRRKVSDHALTMIDCLFYADKFRKHEDEHEEFFSITIVDQDISLVLDSNMLERFPPNLLFNTAECWKMIKIGDMPQGLGFDTAGVVAQISHPIASARISEYYISSFYYGHTLECGIVAQISEPLVDHQISEYYLSSYYSDHSLVPLEELNQVLELLAQRKTLSLQQSTKNGTN